MCCASIVRNADATCYGLHRLIEKRGRNAKLIDWIDGLTAECFKRIANNMNDTCGVRCPDVSKVL
jgi:hypothetical protein